MSAFTAIIKRDLTLALRTGGGGLQTVVFFALVILVFALAIGPDLPALSRLAAPILWAGALLSALVSLDRIFQADFEDGSLDVLIETADLIETRVLAKAIAHWLSSCLPLIVAAPLVAILLNLPANGFWPLLTSLLIGTPALSLIGAIAAALALAMRRAGVLMSIIAAPLYAPAFIFGVAAAEAGADASPGYVPALMLLGAVSLLA
ncbi:MAG: heme exporter protein CcmB, partial [Parvularculaceae bacterium]